MPCQGYLPHVHPNVLMSSGNGLTEYMDSKLGLALLGPYLAIPLVQYFLDFKYSKTTNIINDGGMHEAETELNRMKAKAYHTLLEGV